MWSTRAAHDRELYGFDSSAGGFQARILRYMRRETAVRWALTTPGLTDAERLSFISTTYELLKGD
jgi:hypothetical protein